MLKQLKVSLPVDKIFDSFYDLKSGKWIDLDTTLPEVKLEEHQITRNDVVIPTKDTEKIK